MKLLIYISFFLFSHTSIACDYYCDHDFFKAYASSDLVIITEIDSLNIKKTGKREGKYTAFLNKNETLIIKGHLNKKLVGYYNQYICGGSWTPRLNKRRIIYGKLVNDEYVFGESACTKPLYLDDLNSYLSFKNSANFIPSRRRSHVFRNFELHFLLNNIKLNNKVYDNELVKLRNIRSSTTLNNFHIPNDQYMLFEVFLDKNYSYIKSKKIKGHNKALQKEITNTIKNIKWSKGRNQNSKKKYKILLKFDNVLKNHLTRLVEHP